MQTSMLTIFFKGQLTNDKLKTSTYCDIEEQHFNFKKHAPSISIDELFVTSLYCSVGKAICIFKNPRPR